MAKRWIEGLLYLMGGFLGGLVLVALLAFGYLANYNREAQAVRDQYNQAVATSLAHQGPWPSVTPNPTDSDTDGFIRPVHLSTATLEPLSEKFAPIAAKAENYMTGGQPQKVAPLINDWLSQISSDADTNMAYNLLADAEIAQGHYRIAANHYQMLFYSVPTVENLMKLAGMCETAGYLESAVKYYRLLLSYPAEEAGAQYYAEAQSRIEMIKSMCPNCEGTKTPAP